MDISNQIKHNAQLKRNLHSISIMCGILVISNFLLAISLYKQDSRTILIPTHISKNFMVTDEKVSEEYLELISRDIAHQMLNLTPENYNYVEASILKMAHPSSYGTIKQELNELAHDIKSRDVSTNFSLSEININKQNFKVSIQGYLETKIGLRSISRELKKYHIIYDYSGGTLTLKEFYEVKDEQ